MTIIVIKFHYRCDDLQCLRGDQRQRTAALFPLSFIYRFLLKRPNTVSNCLLLYCRNVHIIDDKARPQFDQLNGRE